MTGNVYLRQNSKLARSAAFKSEHDPQIVTKKKLPDASTILHSGQPSNAQNHGACLVHGNVFIENATFPLWRASNGGAASQSSIQLPLFCFATQVFSRSPMSIGFHFQLSRRQCRLACWMRANSTKPASFQGSSNFCNCLSRSETVCQSPTLQAGIRFGAGRDPRATMMKTGAAGVPGSSATPQAPHSRLDHVQSGGTECNGSGCERCTAFL